MFKLVLTLVFLSTPGLGEVKETTVSFGPMEWNECNRKARPYIEMYESMPGVAVITQDCEPIEPKEGQ